MANIVKCDKCGKEMDINIWDDKPQNTEVFVNYRSDRECVKYDLCEKCTEKFLEWLKEVEE